MAEIREGMTVDGRYRILSRIGSGGMADVWLADDTLLNRRMALKVLHSRFAQDQTFVERFRREASSAAGLQHPNVVGIFDRGDAEGTYYIAMEYLEGRSLKELIDAGLTPEEAMSIVRQILEGARFAHRNGIIHRDFKPQNVIVDPEGTVKVTDFGIARAGVSEITQTGSVMGTAHYLSPEQAQGLDVTEASDLYSIGVILYEALTGRVPFEADSAVAIALKQVSQTPQRPSTLNPEVSPALDGVVLRALEKDPVRRFSDATSFIAALDAARRDPGAAPGGTAEIATQPPVAVLAAELSPREKRAEEDRRRRQRLLLFLAAAILIGALAGLALTRDTTVAVPNVTGNPELTAIQQLEEEGFEVGEINRVERVGPDPGTVLEQDPSDEASLDCSFLSFFCDKPPIDLSVSAGPGEAEVPDVRGLDRASAARRLEANEFGVGVETRSSEEFPEGTVITTDPRPGLLAQRGTAVTLIVSSGPRLVTVPPLIGRTREAAAALVQARGLTPEVGEVADDAPEGQVLSQSPSPGERIPIGSVVSIAVSAGIPQVTVPNVVGFERPAAVTALRDAGLVPVVEERETTEQAENNVVLEQFPARGTRADEGTEVTILVGRFIQPEPQPG